MFIVKNKFFINISNCRFDLNKIVLVLFFLLAVLSCNIGAVSAASNSNIYVNPSGNDSWDGQYASYQSGTNGPKLSLRNATNTVKENGTINIANGQYSGVNNTRITIDKNMNIIGQSEDGTIINGTDNNWIFHIQSGIYITLTNITLTNGNSNNQGGAIVNNGSLNMININFTNNYANTYGGAIYNNNKCTLTLTNSNFINNTASNGGAISNYGNFDLNNSTLTIVNVTNSNFFNNTASNGGAIDNYWATINISNNTFTNNIATNFGGAINNQGYMQLNNSNFTNNTAHDGGAISHAEFYNGADDCSGTLIISNCDFTNNSAINYGGAIINGYYLIMTNCKFKNNNALYGGAIYNPGSLNIENCDFTGNKANKNGGYGGAIYYCNSYLILSIKNCKFTNNTSQYGGAIYNYNLCALSIINNLFNNNTVSYNGGSIYNNGYMNVTGSIFTNNTSESFHGGAIYNDNKGICIINFNQFLANKAEEYGGAIYNHYGNITLNFNELVRNTAISGGAIYNYQGYVNASLNWWGSNTDPSADADVVYENVIVTPWLILNITANPNLIPNNGKSTITADFLHDSNGVYHDPANGHIPDGIPVNFATTLGTITNLSTTVSGIAQSTLNSGTESGVAYVSIIDNPNVQTSVLIDIIPPTANATPLGGFYNTNQNVTINMDEPGTIYYTLNGTIPTKFSSKYINAIFLNSNTIMKFFAMDLAGNQSPIYTINYIIDSMPPTASADIIGGIYNTTKNVSLNMTQSGTIYYTTDGTTPTFNSNRYTSPISIKNTTTLKYLAIDLEGNYSPIYAETYIIDKIPPKANANPNGGQYNITKIVNLTMNEPGTIYYTLNGTNPSITSIKYKSPITIKTATILKYLAIDLAGNKSFFTESYIIIPSVTPNLPGGQYNSTKTVSLIISQPGTIYYTLNGTTPTSASNKYTGPITISSTKILKYLAVDLAGNKSPVYTQTYTIDKTAPKVSSTTPVNNKVSISKSAIISIKFSENIKTSTYYNNIKVKNLTTGKYVTITKSISGNTLSIKTSSTRSKYTWYQVILPKAAIKDYAGNNLAANYTFKFKTGI